MLTKLDVLDTLAEIPVCTGYKINGKPAHSIPADVRGLESIVPVYSLHKGWQQSTEGITEFAELPQIARDYIQFIEDHAEARIGMISTGPGREQTITHPEFAAALKS